MVVVDHICMHCYVSGRVQGVWFRRSAKVEAERLGITGWARNLPDGRVEVLACGERTSVLVLCEWLKRGPTLARVDEVVCEEQPWQAFSDFSQG